MSGTQKVQDPGDHARKYGAFQSEIYANGMFKGYGRKYVQTSCATNGSSG